MAAATARPIPVVNNVITDEDFDNLQTEGKVRTFLVQRGYIIRKNGDHRSVVFTAFWQACSSQCHQDTQTSHRQALGKSFINVLWPCRDKYSCS